MCSIAGFVSILATIGTTRSPISARSCSMSCGAPHERLRDQVDPQVQRASEALAVAVGDRRESETLGRHVDPLPGPHGAAATHSVCTTEPRTDVTVSSTAPSANRMRSPGAQVVGESRIGRRRARVVAVAIRSQLEGLPGSEPERLGSHRSQPHLGAREVGEDRERPVTLGLGGAHQGHRAGVIVGRAMGEVDAEDRGAGRHQAAHERRRVGRRTQGAHELGTSGHTDALLPGRTASRGPDRPTTAVARATQAAGRSSTSRLRPSRRTRSSMPGARRAPTGSRPPPVATHRPPAVVVRELVQDRRGPPIRGGGEPEVRERIGRMRVAAQLGHEHVGAEVANGGRNRVAEGRQPAGVAVPGGSGTLMADPRGVGTATFVGRARPREEARVRRVLVDRDRQDPRVVVEDRLRHRRRGARRRRRRRPVRPLGPAATRSRRRGRRRRRSPQPGTASRDAALPPR